MATKQPVIDELLDCLAGAGPVTAKAMFGGHCVYLNDKPVALVCDGKLYVKPTDAGRDLVPDAAEEPPYPGAKPHLMLPPDQWQDRDALCRLVRATFEALPRPKPRRKKA
jgi:DNA transformation protein and related proteins